MLLWMTSCESTSAIDCIAFRPISVSKDDKLTPETARLILSHNKAFEAVCVGRAQHVRHPLLVR